jgi:hypothetical protein
MGRENLQGAKQEWHFHNFHMEIYGSLNTNLNCLPIRGYEHVTMSHASTTYHVLRSHNNEMDLSWTYWLVDNNNHGDPRPLELLAHI